MKRLITLRFKNSKEYSTTASRVLDKNLVWDTLLFSISLDSLGPQKKLKEEPSLPQCIKSENIENQSRLKS